MPNSSAGIAMPISDTQRKIEITAVVLTGAGKFVFMDMLQWKLLFISFSITAWAAYVIVRSNQVPHILKYWGFRKDNFRDVIMRVLPFGIVSVFAFVLVGYYRDTINITWHIFPILMLYPIWGVIQQFLVIGLVAGNLQHLQNQRINSFAIILVTAILFGLLHYPHYWLMIGTFILALLYGFIYLQRRNIFVMGLFHGILGGLFFYTVVDRDPFTEVFGSILR